MSLKPDKIQDAMLGFYLTSYAILGSRPLWISLVILEVIIPIPHKVVRIKWKSIHERPHITLLPLPGDYALNHFCNYRIKSCILLFKNFRISGEVSRQGGSFGERGLLAPILTPVHQLYLDHIWWSWPASSGAVTAGVRRGKRMEKDKVCI